MPRILITGVSTGIGRASASRFASEGWEVIGTVRDPSRRPQGLDGRVALQRLDLEIPGGGLDLAARVLAAVGCPDVVVNNAGMVQFGPLEDIETTELERLYRVNVFGPLEIVRALLPAMRERGSGTVVNVTSLGGRMTFPFFAGYNSTKWALEGISEGLWHELKPFGIRVKAIEPGFVETAVWGKVMPDAEEDLPGGDAYRPFVRSMCAFEAAITSRTSPEAAADGIWRAVNDGSDRLRYPIAAYATPILAARRVLGDRFMMRFFHSRWLGARRDDER